jgi:hypothetical protein
MIYLENNNFLNNSFINFSEGSLIISTNLIPVMKNNIFD